MMIYLKLFWEFFKVGLFAIGGGMATIPFLVDMSSRTLWFTTSELANMIAVSESTPGPIGVNMATYVGYEVSGILGGLIATLGLIAPSVIIILIIARLLSKFNEKPIVKTTFTYLRPAVIGLITYALYEVARLTLTNENGLLWVPCIACLVLFAAMQKYKNIHPVVWIGLGAVFGIVAL